MKILLLGDASRYHRTLAEALVRKGHCVTVASSGSGWRQTERDIDLSRRAGRIGGALLQLRLDTSLRAKFRGYDIVQLCDTSFVDLRPHRQLAFARRLKRDNGRLFFCAVSDNPILISNLTGTSPVLRYSEWQTPWGMSDDSGSSKWLSGEMMNYAQELINLCDGVTTALYEYHRVMENAYGGVLPITYTGIPIAVPESSPRLTDSSKDRRLNVLCAGHIGRESQKGVDILLPLMRRLQADRPNRIKLITPPNVPYGEFLQFLDNADIVVDQLYSYTPATTALMAMARGAVAITGGEAEYLSFIGESADAILPIFNPDPCNLEATYGRLLRLVDDDKLFMAMRRAGREFVMRHNSADLVAERALGAWCSI